MPVFRRQPRVRFRATEAEVLLEPFQLHIGLDVDAVSCELQIERAIKKNGQHEQLAATLTRIRDYAAADVLAQCLQHARWCQHTLARFYLPCDALMKITSRIAQPLEKGVVGVGIPACVGGTGH